MSKSLRIGVVILLLALLTLAAAWWPGYLLELREQALRRACSEIQLAIERYGAEHEGSFPPDLQTLLRQGYLSRWPDNPFGPGGLVLLSPADPWQPGGIVYIPWGPVIAMPDGSGQHPKSDVQPSAERRSLSELDQYLLVAYSPRAIPAEARSTAAGRELAETAQGQFASAKAAGAVPPDAACIDWLHAGLVLRAGEAADSD